MPYIAGTDRKQIDGGFGHIPRDPHNSGELSYKLAQVINEFLKDHPNGGWNGAIAPVIAALEGARIAFEAEIVKPYEKAKREENGQVFEDWHYLTK